MGLRAGLLALGIVLSCLGPLRPPLLHLIQTGCLGDGACFYMLSTICTPYWGPWGPWGPLFSLLFFRHEKVQLFKVILGAHSLSKNEASKQIFEIEKFIPFSRIISYRKSNDIMLIKVCSVAFLQFL